MILVRVFLLVQVPQAVEVPGRFCFKETLPRSAEGVDVVGRQRRAGVVDDAGVGGARVEFVYLVEEVAMPEDIISVFEMLALHFSTFPGSC
jgi:hypothetical protein